MAHPLHWTFEQRAASERLRSVDGSRLLTKNMICIYEIHYGKFKMYFSFKCPFIEPTESISFSSSSMEFGIHNLSLLPNSDRPAES